MLTKHPALEIFLIVTLSMSTEFVPSVPQVQGMKLLHTITIASSLSNGDTGSKL